MVNDVHLHSSDNPDVERVEIECQYCESIFLIRKTEASDRKFCSIECSNKSMNKHVKVNCYNCDQSFNITKSKYNRKDHFFCSQKCWRDSMRNNVNKTPCNICSKELKNERAMKIHRTRAHGKYGKEVIECKNCSRNFEAQTHENRKFCSKDCSGEYKRKHESSNWKEKEQRNCQFCDEEFQTFKHSEQKFCSRRCVDKSKIEKNRTKVSCDQCSKVFTRMKRNVSEDKNKFCSNKCRNKWMSENWKGDGHPNAVDNDSQLIGYGPNWKLKKQECRERDNHTCQKCGIKQSEYYRKLDVHHIIPFRLFEKYENGNDLKNLITLCQQCHPGIERSKYEDINIITSKRLNNISSGTDVNVSMSDVPIKL